jgi:hypothetical protein
MVWWAWLILVVALLLAVLAFFEWRAWRKPLPRGLDGQHYTPGSGHGGGNTGGWGASGVGHPTVRYVRRPLG